jgi:hypothetical protein
MTILLPFLMRSLPWICVFIGTLCSTFNYDGRSTVAPNNAGSEVVQRAMSRAELAATESSGLLPGGRGGTHYVSDAVNSSAGRARQRLALVDECEVAPSNLSFWSVSLCKTSVQVG